MKLSFHNGERVQSTPEYEDCRSIALTAGVPLMEIQRAAVGALHGPAAGRRQRTTKRSTRRR
jgi:uncharacterized protein (DUF111 family)